MAVPKHSKKVFQGEIFEVHQWEQKMYDGSIKTFEQARRPHTAFIIPVYCNKIVLCRQQQPHRKDPYYQLLGGRVERNERPLQAAKRELMEESGMVAKRYKLRKKYISYHKLDWDIYVYIAKDCAFVDLPCVDAGEKVELVYLSFKQFVALFTEGKAHFAAFENHLLRMEKNGTLKDFEKALFN